MQNKVFWENRGYKINKEAKGVIDTDFLVVGGGIAGVMMAYLLSKEKPGAQITLIEKKYIGSGATGHSAGTIVTELEEIDSETLIKKYGEENARNYIEAHNLAYDLIKTTILEEKIACDMKEGDTYMLAESTKEAKTTALDIISRQKISIGDTLVTKKEIQADINSEKYILGQKVHNALCLNPLKLVQKLAEKAKKSGCNIFENTALISYKKNIAKTQKATIHYKHIILAMDSYGEKNKVNRVLTSIAVTEKLTPKEMRLLKLEDSDVLIEQKLRDFFYLRPTRDNRLLVGFGDKYIKEIPKKDVLIKEHIKAIQGYLKKTFPIIKTKIAYVWTAMYCVSKKGILTARFSRENSEIYGGGLQTTAVVGVMYILSRINGERNPLEGMLR
jgi:gamma-glutamylputrescine oxidase